jgi:hypothetical protein
MESFELTKWGKFTALVPPDKYKVHKLFGSPPRFSLLSNYLIIYPIDLAPSDLPM